MNGVVQLRINRPNVIDEIIDGEVVVINFDTGSYYSIDEMGAVVWNLIDKNANLNEIVEKITLQYKGNPMEIKSVVREFLARLEEENLISYDDRLEAQNARVQTDTDFPANTRFAGAPFKAPTLQKYTDMQEMLLLDPIHEVDETGWPNVPSPGK